MAIVISDQKGNGLLLWYYSLTIVAAAKQRSTPACKHLPMTWLALHAHVAEKNLRNPLNTSPSASARVFPCSFVMDLASSFWNKSPKICLFMWPCYHHMCVHLCVFVKAGVKGRGGCKFNRLKRSVNSNFKEWSWTVAPWTFWTSALQCYLWWAADTAGRAAAGPRWTSLTRTDRLLNMSPRQPASPSAWLWVHGRSPH